MDRWEQPDSIFAPIIAAVPPDTQWGGHVAALRSANNQVPAVVLAVRQPLGKPVNKEQVTLWTSGDIGGYAACVTARQRLRNEQGITPTSVIWQVSLSVLKPGTMQPAVPADYQPAMLLVTQCHIVRNLQLAAQQLAYLRHLWAEVVLAVSPQAIVFGGQHHWQDEWWQPRSASAA